MVYKRPPYLPAVTGFGEPGRYKLTAKKLGYRKDVARVKVRIPE
jgi:hypothetical protein